jgi:hypothetical protein
MLITFGLVMVSAPACAGPGCGIKTKTGCASVCAKACTPVKTVDKSTCKDATLVIKGMKDKNAETEITKALAKQEGFICVLAINHEDGEARVCFNGEKIDAGKISSTIKDLGYDVKVMASAKNCDHSPAMCKKTCLPKTSKEK